MKNKTCVGEKNKTLKIKLQETIFLKKFIDLIEIFYELFMLFYDPLVHLSLYSS